MWSTITDVPSGFAASNVKNIIKDMAS